MRKALFVFALAMLIFWPFTAGAQWGTYFVYPDPQGMYLAPPPVMIQVVPQMPSPRVIILVPPSEPPLVVIQRPPAVYQPTDEAGVETRIEAAGGVQVNTTCTNCTVTNNVAVEKAKTVSSPKQKLDEKPKPAPVSKLKKNDGSVKPPAASVNKLYEPLPVSTVILLALLLVVLFVGLLAFVAHRMGSCSRRPGPSGPTLAPAPANATPVVPVSVTESPATPRRPLVHRKKCEHPDCHHKIEICCHAEEAGGSREASAAH